MRREKHYFTLEDIPTINDLMAFMEGFECEQYALLSVNIDDFSTINDALGYDLGDLVLMEVANRLKSQIRKFDFLARDSGDNYTIIISDYETTEYLNAIISRLLKLFNQPLRVEEHMIEISISIGVSYYPVHSDDLEALIQYANIAMYFSKSTGKRSSTTFNKNMNNSVNVKHKLIQELKTAISEKQFRMFYQPHYNAETNEIIGAEALLRWQHPEQVMVLPQDYLIVAEETGLIIEIEDWIISEVFQQIHLWKVVMNWDIPISINISTDHLKRMDFIQHIKKMMDIYNVRPLMVIFELEEKALLNLDKQVQISINQLTELGFNICIDNFSASATSLAYIRNNLVKQLKINREFINGIYANKKDEAVINSIVSLSQELGISIIAKGVEHEDQIRFLKNINCYIIQGYFYSEPLDIIDFENYVKNTIDLKLQQDHLH